MVKHVEVMMSQVVVFICLHLMFSCDRAVEPDAFIGNAGKVGVAVAVLDYIVLGLLLFLLAMQLGTICVRMLPVTMDIQGANKNHA